MKTLTIYPDKWRTFEEEKPPINVPVVLRLSNGHVVLAQYGAGEYAAGWWVVTPLGHGEWFRSATRAYLAHGASWQPCTLFQD